MWIGGCQTVAALGLMFWWTRNYRTVSAVGVTLYVNCDVVCEQGIVEQHQLCKLWRCMWTEDFLGLTLYVTCDVVDELETQKVAALGLTLWWTRKCQTVAVLGLTMHVNSDVECELQTVRYWLLWVWSCMWIVTLCMNWELSSRCWVVSDIVCKLWRWKKMKTVGQYPL